VAAEGIPGASIPAISVVPATAHDLLAIPDEPHAIVPVADISPALDSDPGS
jgi:hypothetical protein